MQPSRRPCQPWWLLFASVKQVLPWKSTCSVSPFPVSLPHFLVLISPKVLWQSQTSCFQEGQVGMQQPPDFSSVQMVFPLDFYVPFSFIPFRLLLRCPFLEKTSLTGLCKGHHASHHPGCPYSLLFLLFLRQANVSYYMPHFFSVLLVSPTQARMDTQFVYFYDTNLKGDQYVLGAQSICQTNQS